MFGGIMSTKQRHSVRGMLVEIATLAFWKIDTDMILASLDYLFQLAVEMKQLGLPWITDIEPTIPTRKD